MFVQLVTESFYLSLFFPIMAAFAFFCHPTVRVISFLKISEQLRRIPFLSKSHNLLYRNEQGKKFVLDCAKREYGSQIMKEMQIPRSPNVGKPWVWLWKNMFSWRFETDENYHVYDLRPVVYFASPNYLAEYLRQVLRFYFYFLVLNCLIFFVFVHTGFIDMVCRRKNEK